MQQSEQRAAVSRQVVLEIPALRSFGRSLTRDATDAEDLVQETLAKAIEKSHRYRLGTNLRAWLFTIMRNTHITAAKKRARESTGSADCVSGNPVSEATQEWALRGTELAEAVRALPLHYREMLVLVLVRGESYEDSARMCHCAVGTVKSRVARARSMVMARIDGD